MLTEVAAHKQSHAGQKDAETDPAGGVHCWGLGSRTGVHPGQVLLHPLSYVSFTAAHPGVFWLSPSCSVLETICKYFLVSDLLQSWKSCKMSDAGEFNQSDK